MDLAFYHAIPVNVLLDKLMNQANRPVLMSEEWDSWISLNESNLEGVSIYRPFKVVSDISKVDTGSIMVQLGQAVCFQRSCGLAHAETHKWYLFHHMLSKRVQYIILNLLYL